MIKNKLFSSALFPAILIVAGMIFSSGCGSETVPEATLPPAESEISVSAEAEAIPENNDETESITDTDGSSENLSEQSDTNIQEPKEEIEVQDKTWQNNADISWIDPNMKLVALSFDDGPVSVVNEKSTGMRIQKALTENGMHATFFYWGVTLNDHSKKEIVAAHEAGFEIANHTQTHTDLTTLTAEDIEKELRRVSRVLTDVSGQEKFLLRPPYLACNQFVKDTVDVPLISCGLDTKDWDNASTQEIIDRIVTAMENGSLDGQIVLMHETYETTAEAVEYLLPVLRENGYLVVTISEMFKMRDKVMTAGNMYTQCK